jgi:hypothetical protein
MDHIQARAKVCLLCFRKGSFSIIGKDDLIKTIKDCIISDYDIHDRRLPTALCDTCKSKVYKLARGNVDQKFQGLDQLESVIDGQCWISPRIRDCDCLICQVAKANGPKAKEIQNRIGRGRPKTSNESNARDYKLCGGCFSRIYRGCRHQCCEKTKLENLTSMTSLKQREMVASDVLHEGAAASSSSVIKLTTRGHPMSVSVINSSTYTPKLPVITHQDVKHIKTHVGLSQNQVLKMTEDLRMITQNRNVIEPNLKSFLRDDNLVFVDLFDAVEVSGLEGICCNDIDEFIKRVSTRRGHDDQPMMVKLGLDSGRGSLKASVSLLFANDEMFQSEHQSKKPRRSFENGISSAKNFKDNGVKKLLLLGILPTTMEDYVIP